MLRSMCLLVLGIGVAASAAAGECACSKDPGGTIWCAECKMGHAFGLTVKNKKLFDVLAGTETSEEKVKGMGCPGCVKALSESGACDHCRVAFVGQRMYGSPFAATLAAGKPLGECMEKCCKECKEHMAKAGMEKACQGCGWCDECKMGFVKGRVYSSKESFETAKAAHDLVAKAVAASEKCEDCAIAMVTNGECKACKVKFDNGKMAKIDHP